MDRRCFLLLSSSAACAVAACSALPLSGGPPTPTATPSLAPTPDLTRNLGFVGHSVLHEAMNGLTIEGELANHGDAPASARITARFIGSSGAVSGSVSGIVPDVQAGLIKVYQLVMDKTVADIARVQMHLDAAFAGQLIPKFPIDGVAVQRTDAGPVVVGQLTNPETKDHAMTLIAGFWDARSELIGVATCPTIKVGAGETGLFQLRTTDDVGNYRQVVVQVDALVK